MLVEKLIHKANKKLEIDFTEFDFAGGNILPSPNISFIGRDIFSRIDQINTSTAYQSIHQDLNSKSINIVELKDSVKNVFRHNDVSYQPHYHLDLFMNFLETEDSLVIILSKVYTLEGEKIDSVKEDWNNRIEEFTTTFPDSINGKKVVFDYIPIHIDLFEGEWVCYSFSNNLLEYNPNNPESNFAYLPFYKHLTSDEFDYYKTEITKTFKKYGFFNSNITFVIKDPKLYSSKGFDYLSTRFQASMHCVLKVLKRSTLNNSPSN